MLGAGRRAIPGGIPTTSNDADAPGSAARRREGFLLTLATLVGLGALAIAVGGSVAGAARRLRDPGAARREAEVAVADHAELAYCTPTFKGVLERVLHACGLLAGGMRRGCQPGELRQIASIGDADFNALFRPLADRGAVLLFDEGREDLDAGAQALLDQLWQDRRGARYFFVVARASRQGAAEYNRTLSHKRANSVFFRVQERFPDPDLESDVGLLWLGEEFAQLPTEFCEWKTSRPDRPCTRDSINRSVFVSWVDCRL